MRSKDLESVPCSECGEYKLSVTQLMSWEDPEEPGIMYYSLQYDCTACGDQWFDTDEQ